MRAADIENAVLPARSFQRQAQAGLQSVRDQRDGGRGLQLGECLPGDLEHVTALEREPWWFVSIQEDTFRQRRTAARLNRRPAAQSLCLIVPEREARVMVRDRLAQQPGERLDGSGYPDGLRGNEISPLAQVIAVVDVFDALTTARPYRPALTVALACEELLAEVARGRLSPDLVRTFVNLLRVGSYSVRRTTRASRRASPE